MENLTPNQTQIIESLTKEFLKINIDKKVNSDVSIIDSLFAEANDYNNKKMEFNNEIALNNSNMEIKRNELVDAFYSKLKTLFANYKDILVFRDRNRIKVGYNIEETSNEPRFKYGMLVINSQLTESFVKFDNANPYQLKYADAVIKLNEVVLCLSDFETTDVFRNGVIDMFKNK